MLRVELFDETGVLLGDGDDGGGFFEAVFFVDGFYFAEFEGVVFGDEDGSVA